MPHADFVHLRVHCAYSLAEGAIRIKQLIELCRRHAMPAVAVTDSGIVQRARIALAARCRRAAIIGCQLRSRETAGGCAGAPAEANGQRRRRAARTGSSSWCRARPVTATAAAGQQSVPRRRPGRPWLPPTALTA
jgi:hypothetical protein